MTVTLKFTSNSYLNIRYFGDSISIKSRSSPVCSLKAFLLLFFNKKKTQTVSAKKIFALYKQVWHKMFVSLAYFLLLFSSSFWRQTKCISHKLNTEIFSFARGDESTANKSDTFLHKKVQEQHKQAKFEFKKLLIDDMRRKS